MNNNLHVITVDTVREILDKYPLELYEIIKNSYILHDQQGDISAPSSFLFFPHRPESRIIALPAAIKPNQEKFNEISGIKWIASYPNNKLKHLPRASAIIVLNHPDTGFPMVCMEGSLISATRTALSGIVGAEYLYNRNKICPSLGLVGNGFIAKHIIKYLSFLGWKIENIHLYDKVSSSMEELRQHIQLTGNFKITIHDSVSTLIESCSLVVFTTTEKIPYLNDSNLFKHNPCILHISLRDISPDIILNSINIVDDREHILAANTSVHLAYEKNQKDASFITATIGQIIQKDQTIKKNKPIIYSPMGLGILDLTVSQFIYDKINKQDLKNIENFFPF
jgi:2,3-diaminopropionate biosynthesis protein SbnB